MRIRTMPDQAYQTQWFQMTIGRMQKFYKKLPVMQVAFMLFSLLAPFPALAEGITTGEELTLQRAIDIALKNQPSILASRSTVRANEARVGQAKANYYPQLSASGVYIKTSPAASSVRSLDTSKTSKNGAYDQYASSVALNQELVQ